MRGGRDTRSRAGRLPPSNARLNEVPISLRPVVYACSSMSAKPPRVGDVLGDRYELLGVLGEGGQSILFRARDRNEGDEVAVKVPRNGSGDPHAVERLFREAQAMMDLSGTAAVRVLHQVRAPDGAMCLVMEFL